MDVTVNVFAIWTICYIGLCNIRLVLVIDGVCLWLGTWNGYVFGIYREIFSHFSSTRPHNKKPICICSGDDLNTYSVLTWRSASGGIVFSRTRMQGSCWQRALTGMRWSAPRSLFWCRESGSVASRGTRAVNTSPQP